MIDGMPFFKNPYKAINVVRKLSHIQKRTGDLRTCCMSGSIGPVTTTTFASPDSAQTLAAFRIAHGSEGFERLHHVIKEHQPEPRQVLVALETTRGLLI